MGRTDTCTEVSIYCPVSATTLGYYPNLGANVFFTVAYALCALITVAIGLWKRTWAFGIVVGAGFILETCGYIGRILMHSNPWSDPGFKLDLVCIILAPTLICAGIYLTLKHVARTVGPSFSRVTPRLYTWIFIPFDVFCLCLQAVGGGVDAAASNETPVDAKRLKTGNDIILAGIVLQVVNLAVFGLLSLDFFLAATKHFHNASPELRSSEEARIWYSRRFRIFCGAVSGAYAGILIRCIYRIAEMAGGWGNSVMRNEVLFYVLEGAMVLYPAFLLTIFSPGVFFPEMGSATKPTSPLPTADGEKDYKSETPEEGVMSSSSNKRIVTEA
ncbi:putative RTA1 domain protein [Talaromyces proteolyticus]|uniref:RTA1 domain protein n=1 Tax=Talaromyces proteolyticus TaxID=1131652 RepID=A0AAD4PX49_9EURO|nr:putative RTA1 domain protein [Talaromyces proteolyticus]KAH8692731.1 putative RTA1 domain protein [Talaromyces proteolyticus]